MTSKADDIGCNLMFISSSDELIQYINEKDSDKSRYKDKITVFNIFSHGLLGEDGRGYIALGYNYIPGDNKELNIYASDIKDKIYATAFDNPYCWFGSCNLGNNTTDSFAQTWVNKFGGITYAFNGKSYYGYMNSGETKEQRSIRKIWGFRFDGSNNYPVPGDDATAHEFYRKG